MTSRNTPAVGGLHHFLSPRYNQRTDEYGGSTQNRLRLLREILQDTQEEVAGAGAVACRITIDELVGPAGISRPEIEEILGTIGEIPDLWDFVMGSWDDDSNTSRFGPEGEQEPYVKGLKRLTTKPVVGVGRFTSPDLMVRQVTSGILDLIGAARHPEFIRPRQSDKRVLVVAPARPAWRRPGRSGCAATTSRSWKRRVS